jgi:carbonic anhydrase/acetyltransferase-like protein (isoleucine patch superfamily)
MKRRYGRLAALALVGCLPGFLKRTLYRILFGYRIAPDARIGLALIDADHVVLEAGSCVDHFALVLQVGSFEVGRCARVGPLNVIRGGVRVQLGAYSRVMRLNLLNAIPDHDCTTEPQSVLDVGAGAVITSGHRIDFTDRVTLGRNVIVGGRNSSLWTHNRQDTAPIEIGDFCYLGSEVRLAPGAKLPNECILGIGAVLTGEIEEPRSLVGGVPAKVIRPLDEKGLARIRRKTSAEMPDDFYENS